MSQTGRFRVRKSFFGKAILQAEHDNNGWNDVEFQYAPAELVEHINNRTKDALRYIQELVLDVQIDVNKLKDTDHETK